MEVAVEVLVVALVLFGAIGNRKNDGERAGPRPMSEAAGSSSVSLHAIASDGN